MPLYCCDHYFEGCQQWFKTWDQLTRHKNEEHRSGPQNQDIVSTVQNLNPFPNLSPLEEGEIIELEITDSSNEGSNGVEVEPNIQSQVLVSYTPLQTNQSEAPVCSQTVSGLIEETIRKSLDGPRLLPLTPVTEAVPKPTFKCLTKGCALSFVSLIGLKNHKTKTHLNEFMCDFEGCPMVCYSKEALVIHKKRKHADKYLCGVGNCQFKTCTDSLLIRHKHKSHPKDKPFNCSLDGCTQRFRTEGQLKRHRNDVHNVFENRATTAQNKERSLSQSSAETVHTNTTDSKLLCSVGDCVHRTKDESQLMDHRFTQHSEEGPFQCCLNDCEIWFLTNEDWIRHRTDDHRISPFKCDKNGCEELFLSLLDLNKHKKTHLSEFICGVDGCRTVCSSKANLLFHRNRHSDKFLCGVNGCQFTGGSNSHLKKHKLKHKEMPFNCSLSGCDQWFKTKDELETHKKVYHNMSLIPVQSEDTGGQNRLQSQNQISDSTEGTPLKSTAVGGFHCDVGDCGYRTVNQLKMFAHRITVHSLEGPFHCSLDSCDQWFKTGDDWESHRKDIHNIREIFKCDVNDCPKSFDSLYKLTDHKNTHMGIHLCGINRCFYRGYSETNLLGHRMQWHYKSKEFNSDQTSGQPNKHQKESHKRGDQLVDHSYSRDLVIVSQALNTHRTDSQLFSCRQCKRTLLTLKALLKHKKSHLSQVSYKCDVKGCDTVCNNRRALINHKNREHSALFVCNLGNCSYRAGNRSDLSRHQNSRQHSFKCLAKGCDLRFKTIDEWKTHVKASHPTVWVTSGQNNQSEGPPSVSVRQNTNTSTNMKRTHGLSPSKSSTAIKKKRINSPSDNQRAEETENEIRFDANASKDTIFLCPVEDCNNLFKSRALLKAHQKNAHNFDDSPSREKSPQKAKPNPAKAQPKGRPKELPKVQQKRSYVCDYIGCGKAFDNVFTLQKHQKLHPRDHKCTWHNCDAVFRFEEGLRFHLIKHEGTFRCNFEGCTFSASSERQLKRHRDRHSSEGSFCSLCEKWFDKKKNFTEHQRTVHNIGVPVVRPERRGNTVFIDLDLLDDDYMIEPSVELISDCLQQNCGQNEDSTQSTDNLNLNQTLKRLKTLLNDGSEEPNYEVITLEDTEEEENPFEIEFNRSLNTNTLTKSSGEDSEHKPVKTEIKAEDIKPDVKQEVSVKEEKPFALTTDPVIKSKAIGSPNEKCFESNANETEINAQNNDSPMETPYNQTEGNGEQVSNESRIRTENIRSLRPESNSSDSEEVYFDCVDNEDEDKDPELIEIDDSFEESLKDQSNTDY